MRHTTKKMTLHRETLRVLTIDQLAGAVGGNPSNLDTFCASCDAVCSDNCLTVGTCPTTPDTGC
ncbi:MAG: hypothetical protein M3O15_09570 [Acidobacteriota bacterium]|nr:hypothetical protein [Acidobacteriota bacterium]